MKLLDRFYHDDQIYNLKDTNPLASFLHYELVPLIADDWRERYFGDGLMSNYENANNAQFEFSCTLNILDASKLTVEEYGKAREGVMDGLVAFFNAQTVEELQNEADMKLAIEHKINNLTEKWSSDALTIRVEYHYMPLEIYEVVETNDDTVVDNRDYPNGTEEDYFSLLQLKTKDYQSMALVDFNELVLDWANEDYERHERIATDIGWNDFAVPLTDDELSFVKLTYELSSLENAKKIKSNYTGVLEDPYFGGFPLRKEVGSSGENYAYCSLYYQMSYHIPDMTKITVGERDRCVGGVINAINQFWNESSIDQLLSISDEEVIDLLYDLANQYSNELITINFEPTGSWFGYEKADERNMEN